MEASHQRSGSFPSANWSKSPGYGKVQPPGYGPQVFVNFCHCFHLGCLPFWVLIFDPQQPVLGLLRMPPAYVASPMELVGLGVPRNHRSRGVAGEGCCRGGEAWARRAQTETRAYSDVGHLLANPILISGFGVIVEPADSKRGRLCAALL